MRADNRKAGICPETCPLYQQLHTLAKIPPPDQEFGNRLSDAEGSLSRVQQLVWRVHAKGMKTLQRQEIFGTQWDESQTQRSQDEQSDEGEGSIREMDCCLPFQMHVLSLSVLPESSPFHAGR